MTLVAEKVKAEEIINAEKKTIVIQFVVSYSMVLFNH